MLFFHKLAITELHSQGVLDDDLDKQRLYIGESSLNFHRNID